NMYLAESSKLKRDEVLAKILSHDAATPKLIAALVAHMKPNLETPAQGTPGFFDLTVSGQNGDADVAYSVQLPPEYDPHASYPCIVTLHGTGTTPQQQIDWWDGELVQRNGST